MAKVKYIKHTFNNSFNTQMLNYKCSILDEKIYGFFSDSDIDLIKNDYNELKKKYGLKQLERTPEFTRNCLLFDEDEDEGDFFEYQPVGEDKNYKYFVEVIGARPEKPVQEVKTEKPVQEVKTEKPVQEVKTEKPVQEVKTRQQDTKSIDAVNAVFLSRLLNYVFKD